MSQATLYPWRNEPDSLDFEAHGLPCRMRRGPSDKNFKGHWNGYIGVPKAHPLYGKSYEDRIESSKEVLTQGYRGSPFDVLIESFDRQEKGEDGTSRISSAFNTHGGITYARNHIGGESKKSKFWWFGFDCMHSGDMNPGLVEVCLSEPSMKQYLSSHLEGEVYRDVEYVKAECVRLAEQLSRLMP